jgi:hypothetical protein
VRVPEAAGLAGSDRYLDPGVGAVSADLAALGVRLHDAGALDALVAGFLRDDVIVIDPAQQHAFGVLLDPPLLAGAG